MYGHGHFGIGMILFYGGKKIKAIDESVNEAKTIRKFNTSNGFREKITQIASLLSKHVSNPGNFFVEKFTMVSYVGMVMLAIQNMKKKWLWQFLCIKLFQKYTRNNRFERHIVAATRQLDVLFHIKRRIFIRISTLFLVLFEHLRDMHEIVCLCTWL